MPSIGPSAAAFIAGQMALELGALAGWEGRATTEPSAVGTRNAMPVSLPFSSGSTRATAFAAPVLDGMMFMYALRPPRQSFLLGPSCVGFVAVTAWIVAIRPSVSPKLSLIPLAIGARQFVVHDAFETTLSFAGSNFS